MANVEVFVDATHVEGLGYDISSPGIFVPAL